MNNEPNKPIMARELTEKELASVTGGGYHYKPCIKVYNPSDMAIERRAIFEMRLDWTETGGSSPSA